MALGATLEATYVSGGDRIAYTPSSAVAAGTVVVQVDLVGVATQAIAANALGSLQISGLFQFKKASGAAINAGTKLYWDNTNKVVTTTSSGNAYIGKAVETAASSATSILVRLVP